jgi:hypothetical protein
METIQGSSQNDFIAKLEERDSILDKLYGFEVNYLRYH